MRVSKILGNIANDRGNKNQNRVLQSVVRHQHHTKWIDGVRLATAREDHTGIDLVVTTDVGPLYLQVKSSRAGMKQFMRHGRRKAMIALVRCNENVSDTRLDRDTLNKLQGLRAQLLARRR